MEKLTACPLDCYDACEVIYKDKVLKPSNVNPITNGKLCKLFGYLQKETQLQDKNLNQTLQNVVNKLNQPNQKILFYKGSGNMGVMQNITKQFFEKLKATIVTGSLCDGAGEAGIEMGREVCINPPLKNLINSDIIIVWGRNLTVTSPHIYSLIKGKTFITIDPIETKIARQSELFLQIKPKADYLLSKILIQLLRGEKIIDIQNVLELLGISEELLRNTRELLVNKKVSILLGVGVQKYFEGSFIVHQIDKLANQLGCFKPNNGGVWYLSNSTYPYQNKISITPTNSIPIASAKFEDYDIIFIQGANPVVSAPNSDAIIDGLKKSFVIFFGTTYNDTCKYANIIIPAKTFLQKKDVRLSYGHDEIIFTDICQENYASISEYELTSYLFDKFSFTELLSEQEYINSFKLKVNEKPQINFKEVPSTNIEPIKLEKNQFHLITAKSKNSLNSQFKSDSYIYIHPSYGYKDNQEIILSSKIARSMFKVKNSIDVQKNSILVYSGNKDINRLTTNQISQYGNNAIYQELIVTIV